MIAPTSPNTRPLRFEGTVAIDAPRATVWAFISDPATLSQITPGLTEAETLTPSRHLLQQQLSLGREAFQLESDIEWLDMVPMERLGLVGHINLRGQMVQVLGEMHLCKETELWFSADCCFPSTFNSIPSPLITHHNRSSHHDIL